MQGAPPRRDAVPLPGPHRPGSPPRAPGRGPPSCCGQQRAWWQPARSPAANTPTRKAGGRRSPFRHPPSPTSPSPTTCSATSLSPRPNWKAGWRRNCRSPRGQVVHTGSGILAEGEIKSDVAAGLAVGTYALALVCRSQRRVTFTVRNDASTLVDLSLRCGSTTGDRDLPVQGVGAEHSGLSPGRWPIMRTGSPCSESLGRRRRFRQRSLRGSGASPGWRHTRRSTASGCGSSGWSSSRICWWGRRSGRIHRWSWRPR